MYDWANSAYNLVITSTIFPAYYEGITGDGKAGTADKVVLFGREFVNTALYNYALAVAFLVVSIISPILSSIADTRGNKKSFLGFFLTLGSISCATLYFFEPHYSNFLPLGLLSLVIACIGYWSSLVFYNSYLPEIAAPADRDRVSARGFAYGYIGSVILQLLCLVLVFKPEIVGGAKTTNIQYQWCFVLVALWWFFFGQIPLKVLPKGNAQTSSNQVITAGYRELKKVFRQLMQIPVLKRFLFSFFFYNMGVQTVMLAAALYGASELRIPTDNLISAIVLIQLVAIPGAFIISKLSEKIGNIKALIICVIFWIINCIVGYYLPTGGIYEFYGLATAVGFVMGGIQSLSRSTYSKLMPATKDTTSFFSFFDVTEKIAIVIGMFSFGYINELTGSQRSSVLALIVFFVIGLAGLLFTLAKQKQQLHETL